jgi:hypothetical protein
MKWNALAAMAAVVAVAAAPAWAATAWQAYSDRELGFSIEFPDAPTKKSEDRTSVGAVGVSHDVLIERQDAAFLVMIDDYPKPPGGWSSIDPNTLIDAVAQGVAQSGALVSLEKTTVSGYPARDLVVEAANNGAPITVRERIVLRDGRLYQAITARPKGAPGDEAERFVRSISVLK